jgi:thymidylate kinase
MQKEPFDMSKKFIIVEGNDGTGKTTLVDEISGLLRPQGWDTKTLVHRPGNQFQRYTQEYQNADRIVFNRSHFAEAVYGELYRNEEPFSQIEFDTLTKMTNYLGLVIYCNLAADETKRRLELRNQNELLSTDDTSYEELLRNSKAFETIFLGREVIRYQACTVSDLKNVLDYVRTLIALEH